VDPEQSRAKRIAPYATQHEIRDGHVSVVSTHAARAVHQTHEPPMVSLPSQLKQTPVIHRDQRRPIALAAALWHNWNIGEPGRHLTAYDH
jgi:hypothetical protein